MALRSAFGAAFVVLMCSGLVYGQGSDSGSLRGRVLDATGSDLPGVIVTATSPAVMGGSRVAVTSDQGLYRFPSLPPGTYEIKMELTGFKTVVLPNVRIDVGLGLTIDRRLEVSSIEETLTVLGDSPIVDTKNTSAGAVVTTEVLEKIPSSRDLWNTLQQVPGLVVGRENVGGFESHTLSAMQVHGSGASGVQHNLNGMDMTLMHQDNLGAGYFSTDAYEQIEVTTSGISAEHSRGGVVINQVFKSGSNKFRGSGAAYYENDALQANNIDSRLRDRGVNASGAPLDSLFDVSAQLGGPILRDRIWFFNAFRQYDVTPLVLNCFRPGGAQCTNDSTLQNYDIKVNGQASPNNRLMFQYAWGRKYLPNRGIGEFVLPEAAWRQDGRHEVYQGKYDRVISSTALLEVNAGALATPFPLAYGPLVGDKTTAFDEVTQVRFDAPSNDFFQRGEMQTVGSKFTLFEDDLLGAPHDFKFGVEYRRGAVPQTTVRNGDLERRYRSGNPFRVIVYNTPVTQEARNQSVAAFAQDSIRAGRFTINPGVRVEWWRGDLPAQSSEPRSFADVFGGNVAFPERIGLMEWTTVSPRFGMVYDVAGDSRTVLKFTAGRYFSQIEGNRINNVANQNGAGSATFDWTDLDGDNYPDYPTEFGTLIALNLPRFKTIETGLKSPYSDEISATVERGLTERMSVSARYTYRKNSRILAETDLALPTAAFSVPTTAVDPLTGNTISYWSLGPEYRSVRNDIVLSQFDSNWSRYHGVDLVFDRRFDGRWMVRGSLTLQDNYGRVGSYMDRNDAEINAYGAVGLDPKYMLKLLGTIVLPADVNFGWAYRSTGGMNSFDGAASMARLVQVRDSTTGSFYRIRVEENGEYRQEAVNVLDLRASKLFRVAGVSVEGMLDAFNVLNANNVLQAGTITGSTLDRIVQVLPPRILRLGVRLQF
jgi:hypothetical protein